jgi:hypothetical protein
MPWRTTPAVTRRRPSQVNCGAGAISAMLTKYACRLPKPSSSRRRPRAGCGSRSPAWRNTGSDIRRYSETGTRFLSIRGTTITSTLASLPDGFAFWVAAEVEALEDPVPLHNAATPAGIRAYCRILGPRLPMMAVFETAFHAIIGQKCLPGSA